jgi:hypothetical protein
MVSCSPFKSKYLKMLHLAICMAGINVPTISCGLVSEAKHIPDCKCNPKHTWNHTGHQTNPCWPAAVLPQNSPDANDDRGRCRADRHQVAADSGFREHPEYEGRSGDYSERKGQPAECGWLCCQAVRVRFTCASNCQDNPSADNSNNKRNSCPHGIPPALAHLGVRQRVIAADTGSQDLHARHRAEKEMLQCYNSAQWA